MSILTGNLVTAWPALANFPATRYHDNAHLSLSGAADIISIGGLSICLSKYSVRINGMATNLKNTEFRLLHFFMLNNGNVLSREAILRKVWRGNVVVGERTVDVHILKLRKVLARHGIADSIQTIRGIGYRSCFSRANPSLLITS